LINKDIIDAFKIIAKDKDIETVNLSYIIEELFVNLMHKKYGEENNNFSCIVNMDKGEIEIYQEKVIVDNVSDPVHEISLEDAHKTEPDMEVGDPFIEIINPDSFGRRLIFHAKQFLATKIKNIEKESILQQFNSKANEIIIGNVHQIQKDRIFVIHENTEMVLPRDQQMPTDRYRRGEIIRAIISDISSTAKGPEIRLSRTSDKFLERLFEIEVPEIEDGIIEIKSIARAAGDRSKVVVHSSDRRIDAVGACVGMRGSRIQSVVRELNGEKIDIINWSDEPAVLITRAIAPAKPYDLYMDEDRPYAVAVFEDEELAIAIGRNGHNIKLASKVTGYTIESVKRSDYEGKNKEENNTLNDASSLSDIDGITATQATNFSDNNINTVSDFISSSEEVLLSTKGIGKKSLEKISDLVNKQTKEI
jgi:transcription termination/antitermination protein NusA